MTMFDEKTVQEVENTKEQVSMLKQVSNEATKVAEHLTDKSVQTLVAFGAIAAIVAGGLTVKHIKNSAKEDTTKKESVVAKATNAVKSAWNGMFHKGKEEPKVIDAEIVENTEKQ